MKMKPVPQRPVTIARMTMITEGMISSVNPFHLVWASLQRLIRKA
jgi:hypothetical protein